MVTAITVPGRVGTPTLQLYTPDEMAVRWNAPDNNGAAINNYQIDFDTASNFSSPGSRWTDNGTDRGIRIPGLPIDRRYYFRVRAHNSKGWGPWSPSVAYLIPGTPEKTPKPTLTLRPPNEVFVDWDSPPDRGAAITEYEVQADTSSSFSDPTSSIVGSGTSKIWTTLNYGATLYFRVRAKNSQGWGAYSVTNSIVIVSGPRINVGGVWKNSIAYVNVGGVWKVAVPYVRVSGVWRVAGG
jgi:hypothetical protein